MLIVVPFTISVSVVLHFNLMLVLGLKSPIRNVIRRPWHTVRNQITQHFTETNYQPSVSSLIPTEINKKNFTCISFFKFVSIANPDLLVNQTKNSILDTNNGLFGTIIIAPEGVNGQLVIPSEDVNEIRNTLLTILPNCLDEININIGQTASFIGPNDPLFPFKKLIIRQKNQILTDGLLMDGSIDIDWSDAGPELSPEEWHIALQNNILLNGNNTNNKQDKEIPIRINSNNVNTVSNLTKEKKSDTLLLDCRNSYESEMGTFLGADPLQTNIFSESWSALENKLTNVSRETKVLTFCTGGIRCVKVIMIYINCIMGAE